MSEFNGFFGEYDAENPDSKIYLKVAPFSNDTTQNHDPLPEGCVSVTVQILSYDTKGAMDAIMNLHDAQSLSTAIPVIGDIYYGTYSTKWDCFVDDEIDVDPVSMITKDDRIAMCEELAKPEVIERSRNEQREMIEQCIADLESRGYDDVPSYNLEYRMHIARSYLERLRYVEDSLQKHIPASKLPRKDHMPQRDDASPCVDIVAGYDMNVEY